MLAQPEAEVKRKSVKLALSILSRLSVGTATTHLGRRRA